MRPVLWGTRTSRTGLLALAVAACLGLVLASSAAATTTPPAKPAKADTRLYFAGVYFVGGQPVTIPGRPMQFTGVVTPFVRHQVVLVRVYLNGRLFWLGHRKVKASRRGTYGWFKVGVSSPGVGTVTVRVTHPRTNRMARFDRHRNFAALDEHVGFGSTGRFVQLIQQRLAFLHFYIPQTGVYDQGTGLALDAYHRMLRWGVSQSIDHPTTVWLLNGWGAWSVRFPTHGRHAEGNLGVQLLALINGRSVEAIYPISSGKPSTPTVLGSFHVYRKTPGYLPDGMYYSSFFYTGYAIHGYNPAPDYPASHGCMRVPITDAISIYNWLGMGDGVDVYY